MLNLHALFTLALMAARVLAQQNATTSDTEPQCVPMCLQCKFVEAPTLAPNCNPSDLSCLCSTDDFSRAFSHCLRDNCASPSEVDQGNNLFGDICANAGVGLSTYLAATGDAAMQTAVSQVASLLGVSVSGSVPIPTPSWNQQSAGVYASGYAVTQAAIATSSAIAFLSGEAEQASYSLFQEAQMLSESLDSIALQASETEALLATELPQSEYNSATSAIAASLSMVRVAASAKISQDRASADASLAQESAQLFPATSANVNAATSASYRLQIQAGLGLLSILSLMMLL